MTGKMKVLCMLAVLVLTLLEGCSGHRGLVDAAPVIPQIYENTGDPELLTRLESLSEALERQRNDLHIPGMALAVVKDDVLVYARGFGLADLERNIPVTPQTVFAVGSTTKAFTSALAGMLVEEGKMDWDAPVTQYLPQLKLAVDKEDPDQHVSVRDMLSHRTGFARMSLLWVGGGATRQEILADAVKAEPYVPFRSGFYYNNVMYLGAGEASAAASGLSWDQLLDERLLKPLGMDNSTSLFETVQEHSQLASGYVWDEELEIWKQLPMRNLDGIAPAGAINSTVTDMAQWLRLQLNKGQFEGRRLMGEDALLETWKPQIEIGGGAHYGLGWFLQEWEGQPVVQHGGNIDGYAAMVAMLPESKLGFVLLANVTATPLQQASVNMVWDHLAGSEEAAPVAQAAGDGPSYEPYVGEYIADFGPFQEAVFTVQEKDGKLAVNVPGQMLYELKAPDENGKWFFALTNTISVMFEEKAGDRYNMMRMQQSGLNFEIPRKGAPVVPEVEVSELRKFLGVYHSERFKGDVEVLIQNHRLALDVPEPIVFELHLPDENGHRRFRIKEDMSVVFNSDDNGRVVSMVLYHNGEEKDVMPRSTTDQEPVPTLDQVLALRNHEKRSAIIDQWGIFRFSGSVRFPQAGVIGDLSITSHGYNAYRQEMNLDRYGYTHTAYNGQEAATYSSFSPFQEHHGKYLEQIRKAHLATIFGDWSQFYETIEVQNNGTLNERAVHILMLKGGENPATTLFVDAKTGDVLKQESAMLLPGIGSMPVVNLFEDYREVDGLRVPFRVISSNEANGKTIMQFRELEPDVKAAPSFFVLKDR